jgi:hypothetical protein
MTTVGTGKQARVWAVGGIVLGLAIAGALAICTGKANAGFRRDGGVVVSATGAYGAMGAARDSTDGNQMVQCVIDGTDSTAPGQPSPAKGTLMVTCTMVDPTGQNGTKVCVSASPTIIAAAQAIGDSRVSFTVKPPGPGGGDRECATISVTNSSAFSPKEMP